MEMSIIIVDDVTAVLYGIAMATSYTGEVVKNPTTNTK